MSDEPLSPAELLRSYAETVNRLELVLKRERSDLGFCEERMLKYEQELARLTQELTEAVELLRNLRLPLSLTRGHPADCECDYCAADRWLATYDRTHK